MSEETAAAAPLLFQPLTIRGLTLPNRIVISPMATYSAEEGMASDWHFAHLARFALGGAGLIVVEATGVTREGRITNGCTGLWHDGQVAPFKRITDFIRSQGSFSGIQIAHGGRKASAQRPWHGNGPLGQDDVNARGDEIWQAVSPSADAFSDGWPEPQALSLQDMDELVEAWAAAARRSLDAGFDVLEVHSAHGYLLHSFLSPLGNGRTDDYGGSFENRIRFPLRVIDAVRAVWPDDKPLFCRISAVDGVNIGWSIEDSVRYAGIMAEHGVDVVDISTGGMRLDREKSLPARVRGFQVPFAEQVRNGAGVTTMAVGLIRDAVHAEEVLAQGQADLVAIGREALWNPNWPVQAALDLKGEPGWDHWAPPYEWWMRRRARQQGDIFGPDAGNQETGVRAAE
jgi:2,4-dienoyl-CoA reductase-like NADH-dependent reductase (Old Yellow Enzyme family)